MSYALSLALIGLYRVVIAGQSLPVGPGAVAIVLAPITLFAFWRHRWLEQEGGGN